MTTNELLTLCIAGYAAVISTFVLGWDAYKWLDSGPKVRLSASTGMQIVGGPEPDPNTYVSVTAINLGDRATTITNLGFEYYERGWRQLLWRRRPTQAFVIATPSQSQQLPYRFEPGAQWIGMCMQDEQILTMIREGDLYAVLYHAHGGRGVRYLLTARS